METPRATVMTIRCRWSDYYVQNSYYDDTSGANKRYCTDTGIRGTITRYGSDGRVPAVPLQVTLFKYGTSGDTSKNSNDTRAQIQ